MDYTAKTVNLQEAVKDLNARLIKLETAKPVSPASGVVTMIVPPVASPAPVVHESPATPAV